MDAATLAQDECLRIGPSGWSYPQWRARFYAGVRQGEWLAHCARHFNSIEVNATFYRLHRPEIYARWRDATPDDFTFAIKGHRMVTHRSRLAGPADAVDRQRDRTAMLSDKLAAVLWQLPASMHKDMDRLVPFVTALRRWPEPCHAIEFRHRSWFDDETAACLSEHGIAVCQSDAPKWPIWEVVTSDLVYVRLHGHSRLYASAYSNKQLSVWAARIRNWIADGQRVHLYFDNDAEGAAPYDALRLMQLCGMTLHHKIADATP